ncbi:Rid family hydrolase [Aporhodopirellula aestuarii]|uniref:Dioxygenase n=1 Tax=Aporhodopirellula aestuarii TaxID=2950107 RepID=A0ABT0U8Y2_9BACT|nr:Rid family hydrolase [Aporhodopirellula aestuarii]MCM2373372.1 dioxygenase [Aporhodopirellula aestuarii]
MIERDENKAKQRDGIAIREDSESTPSSHPPICYRMHPEKQMLNGHETCLDAGRCSTSIGKDNVMPPCLLSEQQHSVIDIGGVHRVALMITPQNHGSTADQAWEAISTIRVILNQQPTPMKMVQQTVFVRSENDIPTIRRLFEAYFGDQTPVTNYIIQPPCGNQALAIEAWAIGGDGVDVTFHNVDVVTVDYDAMRWIYLSGITPPTSMKTSYGQSEFCFAELDRRLHRIGAEFSDVPRVWLYQGGITNLEGTVERYRELNRARTDFFDELTRTGAMKSSDRGVVFPASTGIGTKGNGLVLSAMALQTKRSDVHLVALENPGQTSAFDYERKFSVKSPKFSRAMAVVADRYATIWVSGTASILDSESVHLGDVEKQTQQTIDNIERLIAEDNLSHHGFKGCGATLKDLAKVRVYIKHIEDYEKCRAICEMRFGPLPIIYAHADVCRPDLLVEIEGVAFTSV